MKLDWISSVTKKIIKKQTNKKKPFWCLISFKIVQHSENDFIQSMKNWLPSIKLFIGLRAASIFTEDWWSYPNYPRSWETVLRENSRCMIYEDVFWVICYIYTFFPFKVNLIIPLFLFISLQCYIELSSDFLITSSSL